MVTSVTRVTTATVDTGNLLTVVMVTSLTRVTTAKVDTGNFGNSRVMVTSVTRVTTATVDTGNFGSSSHGDVSNEGNHSNGRHW